MLLGYESRWYKMDLMEVREGGLVAHNLWSFHFFPFAINPVKGENVETFNFVYMCVCVCVQYGCIQYMNESKVVLTSAS